jgi:DUF1365 family protein
MTVTCLYRGQVTHHRFRPVAHALRYRLLQIYLDLDEAPALARQSRLFGFNGPGLFCVRERDHGDGSATPLKAQVQARVTAAGCATGGAVRLLCMPRVLGFVFNPISIFFCDDAGGALAAIVYQVNNTFGDRTAYVVPVAPQDRIAHSVAKTMHVSPFMDMEHDYDFALNAPGEHFTLGVHVRRDEAVFLSAAFSGERVALSDRAILGAWLRDPLMTFKVVAAIHWEALKLAIKGAPYRGKPHGRMRLDDAEVRPARSRETSAAAPPARGRTPAEPRSAGDRRRDLETA